MTNTITTDTNGFGENLTSGLPKGVRYTLLIVFSVILLLGILNGYRMCAYGMNFSDEPYHILNAMDYKNAPLTVLNSLIGHAFGNIFGWNYLNFRYLAWTFDLLAILTAGSFLMWKTRDWLVSVGLSSCLLFYESISRLIFNLYGWDCLVSVFISAIAFLTLYYLKKQSKYVLISMAILSGMAVLVKITNISLMLIIPFFFIWKFHRAYDAIIYCVISFITLAAGILLIYGSVNEFVYYINLNQNTDHGSLFEIFTTQLLSLISILPYIALCLVEIHLASRIKFCHNYWSVLWFFIITITNLMIIYVYCACYSFSQLALFSGIPFALIILLAYKKVLIACLICVFGLTSALGSDTGLLKFLSIPIILFVSAYYVDRKNLTYFSIIILSFLVSFSVHRLINVKHKTFGDEGIASLTETFPTNKLSGIYTTRFNVDKINHILSERSNGEIFIIGDNGDKYLYEYLFTSINPYSRQIFGSKNKFNEEKYVDSIESHISRSPRGMQYLYLSNDTTTLMYGMLHEKMPLQRRSDDFILFVKE